MNIEELIKYMKKRPGMYVGELNLKLIRTFIDGFMFDRVMSDNADHVDMAFHKEFHQWVIEWMKKERKERFESARGYDFCINQVCQSEEDRVKMFFELTEMFFNEIKEMKEDKR